MSKKFVAAVTPYEWQSGFNFKMHPYEAWMQIGGSVANSHYPIRRLHGVVYKYDIPSIAFLQHRRTAQLRFCQAVSLKFDTFPDYIAHEIIPFIWDCWPKQFENTCAFLKRHNVRTAIFTSSQTAEKMRLWFPEMNIIYCPEGCDTSLYYAGLELSERNIGLFEIGSNQRAFFRRTYPKDYNRLAKTHVRYEYTDDGFRKRLADVKVTVILPKCDTCPEEAGGIETLTQRYWECMLSRMVMVGRAPKELIELIGYDPVIALDKEHPVEQIEDMLSHIEDYQSLVDKNRETALRMGDWTVRMKDVMERLRDCGYDV